MACIFLFFSFFIVNFPCGLMGADDASTSASSSAGSATTPVDDYVSSLGQQITALNAQIKVKQEEVDAAQKVLSGLDKASAQYAVASADLKQKQEALAVLKDRLADKTALRPALAYQNDVLKKVNNFMNDVEAGAEDDATVSALLDDSDASSSTPASSGSAPVAS